MTRRVYRVADLFCGAGGSSSGAARAIRAMHADLDLVAVNHWSIAIATHSRNHPKARHYCVNLDAARPEELVPEGELDLLMASPECIGHSRARGGKPIRDQMRMSAWHVQRWATTLDIRCILVENVPEFRDWGPLLPTGKPDPKRKGSYFQAWIKALWEIGYEVDWRLLNAADFGDATTRVRLFVQARNDGRPIRWPEPTHASGGVADMFGSLPKWRAAREVIDWSHLGGSLLTRPRPLSLKTRLRIARGLERFGGALAGRYIDLLDLPPEERERFAASDDGVARPFVLANRNHNVPRDAGEPVPVMTTAGGGGVFVATPTAEPFVAAQRNHTLPRSADEPLPTITASNGGGTLALVEPHAEPVAFVLGQQSDSAPREMGQPLPTIATAGAISLVEPSVIPYYSTAAPDSVDEPLATATTKARFGLCCPLIVPYGPKAEAREVEQPLPTVMTKDRLGVATPVAEPFVLSRNNGFDGSEHARATSVETPLPTVTARGAGYLVDPFLVPQFGEAEGQAPRCHDLAAPVPAVTSHGAGALVAPLVLTTDQTGGNGLYSRPVDEPLPTLTTKANQALVEPVAEPAAVANIDPRRLIEINGALHVLDIRFRMLTNRELARAMGFDEPGSEYEFEGNVGQVTRQIGNAVAVNVAAALVRAVLEE